MQPLQALLVDAEKIVRTIDRHAGHGPPFKHREHAGLGLLAAADQFLGLGEQKRAKNGERGDVHTSQERSRCRLVPQAGRFGTGLERRRATGRDCAIAEGVVRSIRARLDTLCLRRDIILQAEAAGEA
jgi:hypothetical protein